MSDIMSDIKWGKVVGFLFLLAVVFFLLPWGKLEWRKEVNPAYPITRPERSTAGSLKRNLTNQENEFLAKKKAIDDKLAKGEKLIPDDMKFLEQGLVGLTHLDRQNVQLMERGIKGMQTSPPLVCPKNPEACPSCKNALAIDFGPTEGEKIAKTRKACWQVIVVPETRPHIEIRSTGSPWVWPSGQPTPVVDEPGAHLKLTARVTSIRFMARDEEGRISVRAAKSAKELEKIPSKLVP